jgi:UDP-glucose 4-epimerase
VQNRVEVEALLADWARRHPHAQVTVLRCAWLMGPSYFDRVVRHFARPIVPTLLGYDPLLQFVHEEDCLDAFEQAVLDAHPGVYNVVAPDPLPLSTILRLSGTTSAPLPAPLLYRMRDLAARAATGDPPAAFYDYLRWTWVADGERGYAAFGGCGSIARGARERARRRPRRTARQRTRAARRTRCAARTASRAIHARGLRRRRLAGAL